MDVVDKLGLDLHSFIGEVINFVVVLGFLYWILYKKVFHIIEARQEKIDDGLKKSEEAENILNEATKEKKEIISEARQEANDKINKAVELGKKKKDEIALKAKKESERMKNKAKQEALEQKEKIISESKNEIAKMIILGAEKILGEK